MVVYRHLRLRGCARLFPFEAPKGLSTVFHEGILSCSRLAMRMCGEKVLVSFRQKALTGAALYCLCLVLDPSVAVYAQALPPVALAPTDGFTESFDPVSNVSGIPLVGLRLGSTTGQVNPEDIRVTIPMEGETGVCVRAHTRDGRYHSDNLYRLPDDAKPGEVRLHPVTVKFGVGLSSYKADDFVLTARIPAKDNCDGRDGTYVPQTTGGLLGDVQLLINSRGRRTDVTLTADGVKIAGTCESILEGANIAFDTVCLLDAEAVRGRAASLDLSLDDGFGAQRYKYAVIIPSAPL